MDNDNTLPELPDETYEGPQVGLTDALIRKAAALASGGSSKNAVQSALKLSKYMVDKLYRHELFKSTVAEIADDAVAAAKNKTRADIARMQGKAMAALEKALDKGSVDAVKSWLKAMGMDQEKEGQESNSFTLLLANQPQPQPKTIVVKREGEE